MKKICLISLMFLFIVVLAGCSVGGKTLVCSMTSTDDGIESEQKVTIKFSSDSISKLTLNMNMKFPEEYVSYLSFYQSMLTSAFEEYKDEGLTYSADTSGTTLKMEVSMNPSKMSEETLDSLDYDDYLGTYDEVKATMIEDGYTCK